MQNNNIGGHKKIKNYLKFTSSSSSFIIILILHNWMGIIYKFKKGLMKYIQSDAYIYLLWLRRKSPKLKI